MNVSEARSAEVKEAIAKIEAEYRIERGTIRDAGKFEGQTALTVYCYNCMMDGDGDIITLDAEERDAFQIDDDLEYAAVYVNNDGFVDVQLFTTEDAAQEWLDDVQGGNDMDDEDRTVALAPDGYQWVCPDCDTVNHEDLFERSVDCSNCGASFSTEADEDHTFER